MYSSESKKNRALRTRFLFTYRNIITYKRSHKTPSMYRGLCRSQEMSRGNQSLEVHPWGWPVWQRQNLDRITVPFDCRSWWKISGAFQEPTSRGMVYFAEGPWFGEIIRNKKTIISHKPEPQDDRCEIITNDKLTEWMWSELISLCDLCVNPVHGSIFPFIKSCIDSKNFWPPTGGQDILLRNIGPGVGR